MPVPQLSSLQRTMRASLCHTIVSVILFSNLALLPFSLGQVVLPGLCPLAPAMKNLDVPRYSGRWYEIEKYWFFVEATSSCIAVNYFDTFAVEIFQREDITGKTFVNPGTTRFLRDNGTADVILDLLVTQSPVPFSYPYHYKILDTDYSSYTIKYSCTQVGPFNYQNIWILGREKSFKPATRARIYATLDMLGISTKYLKLTNQVSCPW